MNGGRDKLYVGQTWNITFDTADAAGGAVAFSAAIEAADFDIYAGLGTTQRSSTAGFTVLEDFDSITGAHGLQVDLSDNTDAGFYALGEDLDVLLSPDETVDSQTVVKWIARGRLESAADYASRELNEAFYGNGHIVTDATGNTTGIICLADIAPAAAPDDAYNGHLLAVQFIGGTYANVPYLCRVVDYVKTGQLATVVVIKGPSAALPEAVAVNDKLWFVGQVTALNSSLLDLPSEDQVTGNADNILAIIDRLGQSTETSVDDGSPTADGFEIADDMGSGTYLYVAEFDDGALAGEARIVNVTGTTLAVEDLDNLPDGLTGPFSAAPANGAALTLYPFR